MFNNALSEKNFVYTNIHISVRSCFPVGSDGKEFAAMSEPQVQSLGQEDPLEKVMAIHSSILAWSIPVERGTW